MDQDIEERTINADISEEMKVSYINYAMSVIVSRALPDARDGLKPVHRRILYDMYELGIRYNSANKKCARIVGDVLGKYHPHGDASVYDALVRLGQDFSLRYPAVAPQGNFGSIDGDPPAAMRYTEARMSKIGEEMLTDIQKETVDFVPNYDDSALEPSVLPAAFPFLLTNGSSGIAVGMATNMAPHNLSEVIDAVSAYIDNPEITIEGLMECVKGPDFPSYGIIYGRKGILDAYRTGKGKVVIRARYEIEEGERHSSIIFTELPYQVNKAELVKKIDDLRKNDLIKGISAVRDESDRDGIRIVVELKSGAVSKVVLNSLFSRTQLQSNFNIYNLALYEGRPKLLTLKEMVSIYVDHREEVVERRTRFDLRKAEERAHILLGLKIGLENIDEVIRIIKESPDNSIASERLQAAFNLDKIQADAIIDMKLGRLSHLETDKIIAEYNDLLRRIEYFKDLLSDRNKVLSVVKEEAEKIKKDYGDRRRTEILEQEINESSPEDFIKKEEVVINISAKGFAKRLSSSEYKAQGRGGKGVKGSKLVEGDFAEHIFTCSSHDYILFVSNYGKAYYTKAYEIPEASKTSKGASLKSVLQIENGERITSVISFKEFSDEACILVATRQGAVKKVRLKDFLHAKTRGIRAIFLDEGDELVSSVFVNEGCDAMIITKNGKGLRFHSEDVRTMGRASHGPKGIKLSPVDEVVSLVPVEEGKRILMVTGSGKGKQVRFEEFMAHGRATMGQIIYTTDEEGLIGAVSVNDDSDIIFTTMFGQSIRVHARNIPIQGRSATGVIIARFKKEGDLIRSVTVTGYDNEEE